MVLTAHSPVKAATTVSNGDVVYSDVSTTNGTGNVYTNNAQGTNEQNLTNSPTGVANYFPSWTSNGQQIVYQSNQDGNDEIYRMNADGSAKSNLSNNAAADVYPVASPSGSWVAFNSNRPGSGSAVYRMDIDGQNVSQVSTVQSAPMLLVWSPNSQTILASSSGSIYALQANGINQMLGTPIATGYLATAYAPDGSKILVVSLSNSQLYTMDPDGSNIVQLTSFAGAKNWGAYSPDGTKIVFAYESSPQNVQIFTMNADGSNVFQLSSGAPNNKVIPAWQPVITTIPDPTPSAPTSPVAVPSGTRADVAPARLGADRLPDAGMGGMAAGYAAAATAYGAFRATRRQWDIKRKRRQQQ